MATSPKKSTTPNGKRFSTRSEASRENAAVKVAANATGTVPNPRKLWRGLLGFPHGRRLAPPGPPSISGEEAARAARRAARAGATVRVLRNGDYGEAASALDWDQVPMYVRAEVVWQAPADLQLGTDDRTAPRKPAAQHKH